MIKKINIRALLLSCIVASLTLLLNSCGSNDEGSSKIQLKSFGPSGVEHGDKIKFIGRNLDKVTSIILPPNIEIQASGFASKSNTLIELVVPDEAESGKVTLKTPQGDIETKTWLNFLVPVVITSITEEAKPGTNISIKGSYVNWIESVTFADGKKVTEFVSKSVEELVVTVPIDAKTGLLAFITSGTDPQSFSSETALIVSLPTITDFSPANIIQTGDLTITGNNLDLVTSIDFSGGQTASEFVSQSATEIVVTVPVGTTKGKFTLNQASPIDVIAATDLGIILPVGTGVSPKPATPGVDNLTITGTNLDLVASLTLPGISSPILAANFISQSASQIVLAFPASGAAGGVKYTTAPGYTNNLGVTITLPGGGPAPLPIVMYDETTASGGGDWSWNQTVSDKANTEQFYSGNVSWKFGSTSGGGLSEGGMNPIDASGSTYFSFSLYGAPGSNGVQVACILNDNWSDYNSVILVEGKWTEYKVQLSKYPDVDMTKIVRFALKPESSATIYADRVGFE